MLLSVLGASMAFAVPMVTSEISFFQTPNHHIVHTADVGLAARAPPLAVSNVAVTGGVTSMQVGAFAVRGQETVAALCGFGGDLNATNTEADNVLNGQRLSRQLSAEEAVGVRMLQEISG